jgi:hypothetical protein
MYFRIGILTVALLMAGCGGGVNPITGGTVTSPTTNVCSTNAQTTTLICSGEVNKFSYNATLDTIQINNLPFDGNGAYARDNSYDTMLGASSFAAYVNTSGSRTYVALYHQTTNATGAGVVATGDYQDYGYGGQVYRNGQTVTRPSTGEATYAGDYAGIRIYQTGGIYFVKGSASMTVDFLNFDTTGAIDTSITGRQAYMADGTGLGALPDLVIATTKMTGAKIDSTDVTETDGVDTFATGKMEGTLGATDATEVAGVILIEGPDALDNTKVIRETGAFVLLQTAYTP